jgi:hypothetical protein
MPFVDEETADVYREAWEAWRKQVDHLHRVFLDAEPITPDQIKGLLNREARAKKKYDAARRRLLGIETSSAGPASGSDNPFRQA